MKSGSEYSRVWATPGEPIRPGNLWKPRPIPTGVAGPEDMPSTYAEWKRLANNAEKELQRRGIQVVRAVIDPEDFFAFCRDNALDVNAKARERFANHFVYRLLKG